MPKLLLDNHKLLYHLEPLTKWLKNEEVYPLYCAVSLAQPCNNRCIFCVYDSFRREQIYINKDKLLSTVRELAPLGLKALFFSGEGEPLLHPNAAEIIKNVKYCGVDCALNTNGLILTEEIAEEILKYLTFVRVSINGGSPENYQDVHRSSHDAYGRVLSNLSQMVKIKKDKKLPVTIGVQCVLLGENIEYIKNLTADLKEIGINYIAFKPFLPIAIASYRTKLNLADKRTKDYLCECEKLSDDSFKVIIRWGSLLKIKGRTYDKCLSLPFMIEIDSRGDVYPCGSLLRSKEYCYGNIYNQDFKELKKSKQFKDVVKKIHSELNVHRCMPNCRNDAVNRFLWQLRHLPEHVNFI